VRRRIDGIRAGLLDAAAVAVSLLPMAIRLHRCPLTFIKTGGRGCWQAQKALDEAGVEYELVKAPLRRSKREEVIRLSGQEMVPVIEFEDGNAIREEGKVLAEMIRTGRLFEAHAGDPGAAA
jgi:glutaredoxin